MSRYLSILVLVLGAGCTSGGRFKTWTQGSTWALVRVEIDATNLSNRGNLPLFPPASSADFGRSPTAQGSLGVSDDGRVVCRVTFYEPSPRGVFQYPAVAFDGLYGDRPGRIETVRPPPSDTPLGVTTVLHVKELANGRLRVQGATGGRKLPYVYVFAPPPARLLPVPLPSADR